MKAALLVLGMITVVTAAPARATLVLNDTSFTGWNTGSYKTGTANPATVAISPDGSTLMVTTNSLGGASLGYGYDPSTQYSGVPLDGASYSISASVLSGASAFGNGQQFHFILEQNGSVYDYFVGVTGVRRPDYVDVTFTGTFSAGGFTLISGTGPASPDLSGTTAYEIGFGGENAGSSTITESFQDITGSITPAVVPEPANLSLLGCGLLGLIFASRSRSNNQLAKGHLES